jgi:osmotically-inducible protein OsmY
MHKPNNILESDVRDELAWDPYLDASRIVVKADSGTVTLTGAVHTWSEVLDATDDTWHVKGVTGVQNQLLVGPAGEAKDDEVIAGAARDALAKDPFVPKNSVTPTVENGWVTLVGQVGHHFQRKAAERAVGRVPGVLGVRNEILLSGEPMPADVAQRINAAFARNAILDDSKIEVTTSGHTVYLDGVVGSGQAMIEAVDTAWTAPGVADVVNRLSIVPVDAGATAATPPAPVPSASGSPAPTTDSASPAPTTDSASPAPSSTPPAPAPTSAAGGASTAA